MSVVLFYSVELLDMFDAIFMAFGIRPFVVDMLQSKKKHAVDLGILSVFLAIGTIFTFMLLFLDFYLGELLSLVEFAFEMVLFAVVVKLNSLTSSTP